MSDIEQRLAKQMRLALRLAPDADIAALRYNEHPHWDSVAHMGLVAALEQEFDILLTTQQILDLSSTSKAREILASHGHR